MNKLKVVNLFAGPGAGKSTTRALTFGNLKMMGVKCEEVTEYAKDVTWEGNKQLLADQLFVTANQNRRLERLRGKVDLVISDSPLLLGIHYALPQYLPKTFKDLLFELWDTYDNINVVIERVKPYSTLGRSQTEAEARHLDIKIEQMLIDRQLPYDVIKGDTNAPFNIIGYLQRLKVI